MNKRSFIVLLSFICLYITSFSHPHVFVDIDTYAQYDKEKEAVTLFIDWYMDDMFSFNLMSDYDSNNDSVLDTTEISILSADILPNFKDYGFYTEITVQGKKTDLIPLTTADFKNSLLIFRFRYSIKEFAGSQITFTISDSEYYHAYYWKDRQSESKHPKNIRLIRKSTDEEKGYSDGFMKQITLDMTKANKIR